MSAFSMIRNFDLHSSFGTNRLATERNIAYTMSPLRALKLLDCSVAAFDRLCGLAVRHSLRDREVRGSIPGRVKQKTLKLVLADDPPGVWHYGFSVKFGRPGVRIM
ncbi:hypothetical protein ElyMa_002584900 [Elysia marginata]|uniref:Uncharacterized protein n=1 Tax=Elysia marginata TaxID=1093978 RepID=A0AAV4GZT5_9GAST|nr:hypothetical protein ElyMa_002584900 [Elysia marginata]